MKQLLLRSSMAVEKCDSVCVCLSASIPQEHTTPKLYQILSCMLPGALVWFSSGSDAICCVLLILWMTSCDVVKVTQKRGGCICIHCTVYIHTDPSRGIAGSGQSLISAIASLWQLQGVEGSEGEVAEAAGAGDADSARCRRWCSDGTGVCHVNYWVCGCRPSCCCCCCH